MSSKKYQYLAGLDPKNGEIIYSRSRHDFVKNSNGGWIDGGLDYCRSSGVEIICLELSVSPATLQDDFNYRKDKYGFIKPVKILDENSESPVHIYPPHVTIIWDKSKQEDRQSFAFKRKMATWGTFGKNGKGPRRTIMLENADSDHLEAILSTQTHITAEMREIIESILKERSNHE